jgi:hypothetical protein
MVEALHDGVDLVMEVGEDILIVWCTRESACVYSKKGKERERVDQADYIGSSMVSRGSTVDVDEGK